MREPGSLDDVSFRRAISRVLQSPERMPSRRKHNGQHVRHKDTHRRAARSRQENYDYKRGIPTYIDEPRWNWSTRRHSDVMDRRMENIPRHSVGHLIAARDKAVSLMRNPNQFDRGRSTCAVHKDVVGQDDILRDSDMMTSPHQDPELEPSFPSSDVPDIVQPVESPTTTRQTPGPVTTPQFGFIGNVLQLLTSFGSKLPLIDITNKNVEKIPETASWTDTSTQPKRRTDADLPLRSALHNYCATKPRKSILKPSKVNHLDGLFPLTVSAFRSFCSAISRTFFAGDRNRQEPLKPGSFVRATDSRIITQLSRGTSMVSSPTTDDGDDDWFSRAFPSSLSDDDDDDWVRSRPNYAMKSSRKRFRSSTQYSNPKQRRDEKRQNHASSSSSCDRSSTILPDIAPRHALSDDDIIDAPIGAARLHPYGHDLHPADLRMPRRSDHARQAQHYFDSENCLRFAHRR